MLAAALSVLLSWHVEQSLKSLFAILLIDCMQNLLKFQLYCCEMPVRCPIHLNLAYTTLDEYWPTQCKSAWQYNTVSSIKTGGYDHLFLVMTVTETDFLLACHLQIHVFYRCPG